MKFQSWAQRQRLYMLHKPSTTRTSLSVNIPALAAAVSPASPVPSVQTWPARRRHYTTSSLGGVSGVNGNISNGKINIIDRRPSTTDNSPVLQAAASKGRTAMKLVETSKTRQVDLGEFHQQSLKEATNQLLSATKATSLLADSIAEIRERQKSSSSTQNEKTSDAAAHACLQELHKAFLSLTQSLLNCLDPEMEVSSTPQQPVITTPLLQKKRSAPQDSRIIDLLLTLAYRAHQLSLPFHYPLYQRLAVVLSKQPQLFTMRSRAEWVWNIQQWSQIAWGDDVVDMEWFRPSLLALAEQQHWSDLGYLIRIMLQPSVTVHQSSKKRGRRKKRNRKGGDTYDPENYGNPKYLREDLVRDLLMALDRHQVFPNLWKNLQNPSVVEEDILEVLLLMESSIWRIFEHDPDAAFQASSLHKIKQSNSAVGLSTPDVPLKASLRDAIEVLLKTSRSRDQGDDSWRTYMELDDEEPEGSQFDQNDSDDIALSQTLLDLSDILDNAADLDDESEEDRPTADAIALAAMMLDPRRPRVARDLEVIARRSGYNHILEVSGLTSISSPSSLSEIADQASPSIWDDDDDDNYDAADMIYSRVPGYQDNVPDIMPQIYQHNGNRSIVYSIELEDEIYYHFRQPPYGYFDEDEDD